MEQTNTNRAVLLDLANGGDGHAGDWIEKVTLRKPGQEDTPVYVLHIIPRNGGKGLDVVTTLETCYNLMLITETGATPRNPDQPIEEYRAAQEARRANLPQPEDCGRIISDLAELDKA